MMLWPSSTCLVQIAYDLFQVNRDSFHGHPCSPAAPVTDARGFYLGDPTIPRQPDGSNDRPPSGGLGYLACADNVNMRSPSHDRNPKHFRWHVKGDCLWECPGCKKNYGQSGPGHVLTPGKCKLAKTWKPPDNHGQ
eukprot:1062422-Pyramimonas_sp.AAC.1